MYETVDEQRQAEVQARLNSLATAQPAAIDPDSPWPDYMNHVADWGSDLQAEAITYGVKEPRYLPILGQSGFIRVGFAHLLSAAPKLGKTELLLQSIADWRPLDEVVYYYTEEYRDLWVERLAGCYQRGYVFPHVKFMYLPQHPIESRMNLIRDALANEHPTTIVVDTIRAGLNIEDEADNHAIRRALEPLTQACHAGNKTLILVHHTSKARGQSGFLDSAAGGYDFLGAVDGVLNLSRKARTHQMDTRRRLVGAGRMRFGGEMTYHWPDTAGPLVVYTDGDSDELPSTVTEVWQTTKDIGMPVDLLKSWAQQGLVECSMDINNIKQGTSPRWRLVQRDYDPDDFQEAA